MRKFILLMAAALAATPMAATSPASAKPPRVKGERCHFPNVQPGTWVGHFSGYKPDPFISDGRDRYHRIFVWRCFESRAACNAWKYWIQTDHQAPPGTAWCRKK